ncbi:MAG: hypothetical protein A2X36_07655 [Elusimicrobia bacterium GWA2_69_24]|nr:MAG: hypothetical protein A2X36_07655 [Elusimicrobia bacterium GWA2_69_24]HBL17689.1 hypothetical protein [Elusimicrobiota bacterium]
MKRSPFVKAGALIRQWSSQKGLEPGRMQVLNEVWEREAGHLARHWTLDGVRGGILYVKTASPAAAQELQMRGGALLRSINKHFRRTWLRGIRTTRPG